MSVWIHTMCAACWKERHPDRVPIKPEEPRKEPCCGCGFDQRDGIVVRADPQEMQCKGIMGIHREKP